MRNLFFLLLLSVLATFTVKGQNTMVKNDTIRVLENEKEHPKDSKLKHFFKKLILKNKNKPTSTNQEPEIKTNQNFELGEGKIIRKINIITLDPFGFSESDTAKIPQRKIEIFGNRMHLKTKGFAIRNYLIFKENQPFDSLIIKETERLIRTQHYVRRVMITPIPIANNPDSVDVSVRVLDSWSIYPTGSLSTSTGRIQLTDRNFGGFGHEMSAQYKTKMGEDKNAYSLNYRINNIKNSFIRANLLYDIDLEENYIKSFGLNRSFYSPYSKWAGGANIYQRFYRGELPDKEMNYELQNFKYNIFDLWGGSSFPLFTTYKEKAVTTNLRSSLRYSQQNFSEKPSIEFDPLNYYGNQKLILASIGLSSINYVQDKFIYNYDIIEDVQVGKIFSITGGWNERFGKKRSYFGAKLAFGKYTQFGYFSTNIEWGSYFFGKKTEQGALRIEGVYFTKLMNIGNWKFRHFLHPELVLGYNRFPHVGDELLIEESINGLNASRVKGTRRFHFSYQAQSYSPYNWKGFRINPFINIELGFIGNKEDKFLDPKMYSKFGIGVVIFNDYLVFRSIQLSLSYYPSMPDQGRSMIKTNTLRNYNFTLQNFNYSRPETVQYR